MKRVFRNLLPVIVLGFFANTSYAGGMLYKTEFRGLKVYQSAWPEFWIAKAASEYSADCSVYVTYFSNPNAIAAKKIYMRDEADLHVGVYTSTPSFADYKIYFAPYSNPSNPCSDKVTAAAVLLLD